VPLAVTELTVTGTEFTVTVKAPAGAVVAKIASPYVSVKDVPDVSTADET
jgi:hypothetical protein